MLDRARALESHFTNGKEGYKYSLDSGPGRDRSLDPVVDFVTNHKSGHCQFFASALVLMLRSQGIPARVVVGYRADTFNVVGNYYQLREMDAHAWVEAAIPAAQVPADEVLPTEGIEGRDAWVRLDPTPAGDWVVGAAAVSPWRQQLGDRIDYMQLLWSQYVLGLNEKRQRQAIYDPIRQAFKDLTALVFSRDVWVGRWEAIRERFQGDFFTRRNLRDALLAVLVLTSVFYLLRFCVRSLWRGVALNWKGDTRRSRPRIEFYRRLETLLANRGIRRGREQTSLEFAQDAARQLGENELRSRDSRNPSARGQLFLSCSIW